MAETAQATANQNRGGRRGQQRGGRPNNQPRLTPEERKAQYKEGINARLDSMGVDQLRTARVLTFQNRLIGDLAMQLTEVDAIMTEVGVAMVSADKEKRDLVVSVTEQIAKFKETVDNAVVEAHKLDIGSYFWRRQKDREAQKEQRRKEQEERAAAAAAARAAREAQAAEAGSAEGSTEGSTEVVAEGGASRGRGRKKDDTQAETPAE